MSAPSTANAPQRLAQYLKEFVGLRTTTVREVAEGNFPVSFMEDLKALAKAEGLWNLFLPALGADEPGVGVSNIEYAPLAEIMGRVSWASDRKSVV